MRQSVQTPYWLPKCGRALLGPILACRNAAEPNRPLVCRNSAVSTDPLLACRNSAVSIDPLLACRNAAASTCRPLVCRNAAAAPWLLLTHPLGPLPQREYLDSVDCCVGCLTKAPGLFSYNRHLTAAGYGIRRNQQCTSAPCRQPFGPTKHKLGVLLAGVIAADGQVKYGGCRLGGYELTGTSF